MPRPARYKAGRPLSPVDGCPVAVKDIIATADMPTQMNSPIYKGWRPKADAACVAALAASGRRHRREDGHDRVRDRTLWTDEKSVRHDANAGRLLERIGRGGRVRHGASPPSARRRRGPCFGLRPTAASSASSRRRSAAHRRHPSAVDDLDHLGVIAASVEDAWRGAAQISLGAPSPGVGFLSGAGDAPPASHATEKTDPAVHARLDGDRHRDARELRRVRRSRQGARDRRRHLETTTTRWRELEHQFEKELDGHVDLIAYEMRWPFEDYLAPVRCAHGGRPYPASFSTAREVLLPVTMRPFLRRAIGCSARAAAVLARCDGFITLACSGPAPRGLRADWKPCTFPSYASWLGLPAFSLPLLAIHGLPVGVQLIGRAGADSTLCADRSMDDDDGSSPT